MTRSTLRPSTSVILTSGVTAIVIGIASALVAAAPFDGFVRGFFQGAGVMLMLIGAYALGTLRRKDDADTGREDGWLPSRDGDR